MRRNRKKINESYYNYTEVTICIHIFYVGKAPSHVDFILQRYTCLIQKIHFRISLFPFPFFLFCFWVLEKAFRVLGGWSEGGTRRKGWWVCGQGVKQTNKQTKDYLQRGRILLPSRYWYLHFMFFSCLIAIAKNSSSILSKGKDMLCCSWIDNKQFQFVCI